MAQNPNAMQEPSMDELLASIREIIEENTGPSPNRNPNRQDVNAHEPAIPVQRNAVGESQTQVNPNPASPSTMPRNLQGDDRALRLDIQQYGDVGQVNSEAPPVQDAMNALAARIGLRHNEDGDGAANDGIARDDRPHLPPPPAAMVVKSAPSERAPQAQVPNPALTQARTMNTSQNAGNVNSSPAHINNAQNVINKPISAVQARHPNPVDQTAQFQGQPMQQRAAPIHAQNQAAPQTHLAPQTQVDPLRQREMPQVRPLPQQREAPQQNESAIRNQQMQVNAAAQQNGNRQMPPQPRVANPNIRPNQVAPQNNVTQNIGGERRTPIQQPNFNAEPHIDERRDLRASSQPLPQEVHASNDLNPNRRPVSASVNQPNIDAVQDERQILAQGQSSNLAVPQGQLDVPDAPHNVPFPRSAPSKPHFLSQALRSAFMSIPAKDSAFQTASSLPQAPLRPQSVSSRSTQPTRVEQKAAEMIEAEVKREMDNIDRALEADFEKSAENLLRPYIAKWLDEHFSELFEKVLREEIKRVIQAQLR
ncbi:DUF2497 domain-containing protein [Bartonella sp. HY761]|uniref:DUF2497 domain-containing protein n=1 Tax=Bartonella sp. HY761 TaxID=2979330 RepID=UPI0021F9C570|nr:DUF2497 domain-containing protein [Bartonella sp. HY761]UXN07326.1 DUF2497 domain-containing protein [Bartonella sp. HY761]